MTKPKSIPLHCKLAAWLLCLLTVAGCQSDPSGDLLSLSLDSYRPVDEFVPAYEAITAQAQLQQGRDYDLEQTVRVLNAMELAQVRSKSFDEFLDFMARQDYSRVAPDVLEAKRKLFPVLEYMYKLQQKDEQLGDTWLLVRSAARGGQSLAENVSLSRLIRATYGDVFAVLGIVAGENADQTVDEAFSQYEQDKKLKAQVAADLQRLRTAYRQYLEDYAPIYQKYMREYDALCIEKDRAYLDLYAGHTDEALKHTGNILRQHPDNGEALLLEAMGRILKGGAEAMDQPVVITQEKEVALPDSAGDTPQQPPMNASLRRASDLIQHYNELYPDRTAPALVLEGLLLQQAGDEQGALSRFNQASVEYPRQAQRLTDMLDSYNTRSYLTQTPEGQYLRRLYASTMEGYGLFSPNLLKARHYANQGDFDKAREEIYNHFFRRGNQGLYDELLSDMQFCEENLYAPFKSLLLEQSYLDVQVEPESSWMLWTKDDVMHVRLNNRSDIDLENVRIFLCIHYTDMYRDEYDVVKVPHTVNVIPRHSTADLDTVHLDYPGKSYADITRVRAIAMTDDRICWVDDVHYKESSALAFLRGERRDRSQREQQARDEYLSRYSLQPSRLQNTLREGTTIVVSTDAENADKSWWQTVKGWFTRTDRTLRIELPRVVAMTDPVFSLHPLDSDAALSPVENYLHGTSIRLHFDYEPSLGEELPLYIYSDGANFCVHLIYNGKDSEVQAVDVL